MVFEDCFTLVIEYTLFVSDYKFRLFYKILCLFLCTAGLQLFLFSNASQAGVSTHESGAPLSIRRDFKSSIVLLVSVLDRATTRFNSGRLVWWCARAEFHLSDVLASGSETLSVLDVITA